MTKDPFKTRLEIAKKKALKRDLANKKYNPSPIGKAFKSVSYTHLTLPTSDLV